MDAADLLAMKPTLTILQIMPAGDWTHEGRPGPTEMAGKREEGGYWYEHEPLAALALVEHRLGDDVWRSVMGVSRWNGEDLIPMDKLVDGRGLTCTATERASGDRNHWQRLIPWQPLLATEEVTP